MAQLLAVPHRVLSIDRVAISAADPGGPDVSRVDELGEDPLGGPLGDPDPAGDVPEPDVRVLGEAEQHLRVVRQERPGLGLLLGA